MYLGVDIGGTTIGIGVVDRENKLVYYENIPTNSSYDSEVIEADIVATLEKGLSEKNILRTDIESIGIGVPGIVDTARNRIVNCPNINWSNMEFGRKLFEIFGLKPYLFNDATSAAFGELKIGKMRYSSSGVMLTLGTGVGGGIVMDGKTFEGHHGIASEIGHMTVGDNFYDCGCGRTGCLETFVSGSALIRYGNRLLEESGSNLVIRSAKEVFELYKQGHPFASKTVKRFIKYLSIGIVNIVCTLDPEIVVIGGGLSGSGDIYIEKLRDAVYKGRYFKEIPPPRIELSSLDESAGAVGAALLGKETTLL